MSELKQDDKYEKSTKPNNERKSVSKKTIIIGAAATVVAVTLAIGTKYYISSRKANEEKKQTVEIEALKPIEYTKEEIESLKKVGYSDEDIKSSEKEQLSVPWLIEDKSKKKDEELRQRYLELREEAKKAGSPEFKQLLDSTWLGGMPKTVYSQDINNFENVVVKENVDYIKLPARGSQLMLKLTLANGENLFHPIRPDKWQKLQEKGNIVIEYTEVKYGGTYFIVDIREIDI